jgi:hypothetical protein
MELPGRGCRSAWWGPLARILVTVLALVPLLSPPHGTHTEHFGNAPRHGPFAMAVASGHGSHCLPVAAHGAKSCTIVPCCGVMHLGCCPLLVTGADLPDALLATPPASDGAAFASLRGPPPLPPPITSPDR